jgi:hypothetical protein
MDHTQAYWVIGLLGLIAFLQIIQWLSLSGWLQRIYNRLDRIPKPQG